MQDGKEQMANQPKDRGNAGRNEIGAVIEAVEIAEERKAKSA